MKKLLELAGNVLLFKHEAYAQHADSADVLKRGLALLVVMTLIAGSLSFIINIFNNLRPMSIAEQRQEMEQVIQEFTASLHASPQYSNLPPEFETQMVAYMRSGMEIGLGIEAIPTRLPKPMGGVLTSLGAFLSLPFTRMASWIGYTIWVLLIAKLLGGRATVSQTLGATALYAVPHVLDILGSVRCLGGLLGLVATVWGIAIYVKALAVANDFDIGRAVIATVVPTLVGGALTMLGALMFFILILASG
ncbi:MAG: YIP1 family protein [Chloroflexi bacterium]|nr:YIP1 family protein [Chloroflexota bacterium]